MKTSKLLVTSLLAAAAMSVPANADIYISYGANNGENSSGNGALTFDPDSGWNKATKNTNSTAAASTILKDTSGADSGVTTTWSSKNTYMWTTATDEVLKGYLDDGDSGVSISVSDVSYLLYDVTIIAATDTPGVKFSYKTVNGVAYTSDGNGGAIQGTDSWGASRQTEVNNNNSFTISGLTGDLSISSVKSGTARGCIAGLVITNTGGTAVDATLSEDAEWTSTSLAGTTWTNATDDNRYLAHLTLGSNSTLNVTGTDISTTAIVATTADGDAEARTLTLSGNAVSLIGPAVVRTDSTTASIVVNNTLNFAAGGKIFGNVSTGTGGSLNVTGGTLNVYEATDASALAVALSTGTVLTGVTGTDNSTSGATDLTKVTGSGKIEFAAVGSTDASPDDGAYSWVKLSDQFTGTLSITSGIVDMLATQGTGGNSSGIDTSRLGGTTLIELNGGGLLFRNTTETFNKNISVASGNGVIRVYGDGNVTLDGNISGTGTLTHTDGGTLKFSGDVDIGGFNQVGGRQSDRYPANTEFSGASVRIGTLNVSGASATFSGASTTITTANVSGGTLNLNGTTTLGTLTATGGTVNFNSTTATQLGSITATGGTTTFSGTGAFTVTGTGIIETKNGAVVNQTSGVAEAYRLVLHNSQANGADAYNLSGGVLNITSTFTAANNTAAVLVGHWGANGGTASGALNLSGTGVLNVANGSVSASHTSPGSISISGDSELNANVLHLKSQGSSSQVTVSGNGRLNLGKGGFDNTTATNVLTFNGGTLGTFADAFSSSGAVSLGANGIIVDTEKRTLSTTGASSASGSAASITLNGVLSDATDATGSLTKRGAGTLTLGGANTYTGETVIEAGTLVAANANALGTGNVTVASGATLDARAGLQVGRAAIASTLTTNGSAKLVLGALNENTAAVAVTGDVMLSAGTIFDVGSLVADGKVVSFAGTLTVASGTLTKNNFLLNGAALGDRTHFEVSTTGNAVTISNLSHDVYTLTWYKYDESGSAVWSNGCTGWSYQASETSVPPLFNKTFQNGDNVIFSDDAPVVKNVVVDGAVSVGTMTIDSDANFAFSGQNGAAIGSSGALTKTGTGTATIDSTVDLYRIGGGIVVNGGKLVVDTASGYTGAVTAGENGTFTLNVSSDTTLLNTLSGAGTFEKTGAGTLILSRDNASLTGKLLISGGVVELASSSALGADSVSVEVAAGGTLDLKGKTKDRYYGNYVLSGGALINTGAEIGSGNRQLAGGITLKADSEIGGTENFGMVSGSFAKNTLTLNGHTLTKTGTNIFWLTATTVTAGTIDVQSGALKLANGGDDKLFSMESGSTIKLNGGTISAGSASVALGNVAIVLTDVNKGTARITADTNCSFNAGGATLYLDIGALTETVLTGEEVALTIAGSNVISAEGFFETVLVGTYDSGNNWINDTKWAYEAGSWNAAEGTLLLISVPEPSVFGLLAGLGALALAGTRRRRQKKA